MYIFCVHPKNENFKKFSTAQKMTKPQTDLKMAKSNPIGFSC